MIQSATILITPETLGLVASIDEFKGTWRALGTPAPDRLSALLWVATIEGASSLYMRLRLRTPLASLNALSCSGPSRAFSTPALQGCSVVRP